MPRPSLRALLLASLLPLGSLVPVAACGHLTDEPVPPAPAVSVPSSRVPRPLHMVDALGEPSEDREIQRLQGRVLREGEDPGLLVALGRAFGTKATSSHDPGFWLQAESAARAALSLDARSVAARVLLGEALLDQHRFGEVCDVARSVLADDPRHAAAWALLSDALAETGDYAGAREAADRMVAVDDGPAALARRAWILWLQGDPAGALRETRGAVDLSAAASPGAASWTLCQLGELLLLTGDPVAALAAYRGALDAGGRDALALAGAGRALLALGRAAEAEGALRRSLALRPLADVAWALADALAAQGRPAAEAEAEVERLGRLADPRTLSLWLSTRGGDPARALALARAEASRRRDVATVDALAWALYRSGRLEEAAREAESVLAVGTRDPKFLVHAGRIAWDRGQRGRATELMAAALGAASALDAADAAEARSLLTRVR